MTLFKDPRLGREFGERDGDDASDAVQTVGGGEVDFRTAFREAVLGMEPGQKLQNVLASVDPEQAALRMTEIEGRAGHLAAGQAAAMMPDLRQQHLNEML
jgi:hypothetical protein